MAAKILAEDTAHAGRKLPTSLMIQADNTCREQRNQTGLYYGAWLASQSMVSCGECYAEVGHTHNEVDQRFSVVRAILSKASTLETPEDWLVWRMP